MRTVASPCRPLAVVLLVVLAIALAGCGSGAGSGSPDAAHRRSATLVLDFTPNAIHAGIYTALARGFDRREGISLHVVAPSATTDSIKLLTSGRAQLALLDIHDLALARERGADVVGVMAIVQRPLAAVFAAPSIRSPRQLEGRLVGVTGVPSDTAVLRSVVSGAGGDPAKVRTVTIGFNAVPALLAHRVSAALGFWNDEGVTLTSRGRGFHVFRVDDYGAPAYPELVLCTTRSLIASDPSLVRAVVRTLARGYAVAVGDPARSAASLESEVPGLDPALVAAQLAAEEPAFVAPGGSLGELNAARLQAWAGWELRFGIVSRRPDVRRMFDSRFLAGTQSPAR